MLALEHFKESLGKVAERHTEEELIMLNDKAAKLAEMLYDIWSEGLCKEDNHKCRMCKDCRTQRSMSML